MKAQVSERLYQYYRPAHESKKLLRAILSTQQKHGKEFKAFARNLGSGQRLSVYIRGQVQLLKEEEAKDIANRQDAALRNGKS